MAEPENLDDEFFNDLYDDHDAAPNASAKPAAAEEPMSDAPAPNGPEMTTETHGQNGNADDHAMNGDGNERREEEEEEEEDDDDIDFNLGNPSTHVPTAGVPPMHQDSPTPSATAMAPSVSTPQPSVSSQGQSGGHHGHQKGSNSKEDG